MIEPIQPMTPPEHEPPHRGVGIKTVFILILISIIAGMGGGVYGSYYLSRQPAIQRLLGQVSGGAQAINQNVVLQEESAITDVVKQASPAVVSIVVSRDVNQLPNFGFDPFNFTQSPNVQEIGAGTGFLVSADGLIMTNKHVVSDTQASYTVITNDGKEYSATVVARDPSSDLALVKIDSNNAPHLAFADSSKIQLGQHVVAIGNSLGQYQNTVTSGIVSGIGRSIIAGGQGGSEQLEGVIQTDAAINPGNSGGPLLNLAGQIIGINTAVDREGQLVGFAIPSNDAKQALESFQRTGRITRPFLGVRYVMLSKATAEAENLPRDYGALLLRGQTVTDFAVLPGSPADKAGLVENDIILEVEGVKLDGTKTLAGLLKKYKVGDSISLKVYSKGDEKTVTVTLGETK